MFCSECGKPARGKFCSHCGSPLMAAESTTDVGPTAPDWEHTVQYEAILKFPGVREQIDRHARQAPKKMTGEQFMAICDKLVPIGISYEGLAGLLQPLYAKLGYQTGKQRTCHVDAPVARVIVRALCSLARNGHTLRAVNQANDGCVLEAALPSNLFTLEGDFIVTVRRNGSQAEVSGATRVLGQLTDWGKSNRCLDQLFSDLAREAA